MNRNICIPDTTILGIGCYAYRLIENELTVSGNRYGVNIGKHAQANVIHHGLQGRHGNTVIISAYRYYRKQEATNASAKPDRLIVQTGTGETVIRQDEIEYLESARNYVVVGTGQKEYLIRETLANLEEILNAEQIIRTHRSYLVNLDFVEEMRTTESGGHQIRMRSGKHVPLSRGYREKFRAKVTA